jgi:DNA-directed RNA polymerase subunit RPC12/RpoP
MSLPTKPTRTDAYVRCACGGTMMVMAVAPIPNVPDKMRHSYACVDCGAEANFEVAKKAAGTQEP